MKIITETTQDNPNSSWWAALGWCAAIGTGILLFVMNGAVGFLGSEENPSNAIFAIVLAAAILSAFIGRFRSAAMVVAMRVTAFVQVLLGVFAFAAGLGRLYEITLGTIMFVILWLFSAWVFNRAAGGPSVRKEAVN